MIISNKYLSLFRWLICKYLDISTFKGTCVYIYIHMYHLIHSLLSIQGKKKAGVYFRITEQSGEIVSLQARMYLICVKGRLHNL